jgi:hypothetical protein
MRFSEWWWPARLNLQNFVCVAFGEVGLTSYGAISPINAGTKECRRSYASTGNQLRMKMGHEWTRMNTNKIPATICAGAEGFFGGWEGVFG